jgi:hypothetical protein
LRELGTVKEIKGKSWMRRETERKQEREICTSTAGTGGSSGRRKKCERGESGRSSFEKHGGTKDWGRERGGGKK